MRRARNRRTNISRAARIIYRSAFNGEALPKRCRVYFVDSCSIGKRSGYLGTWNGTVVCVLRPSKRPVRAHSWLRTLIHEFIHQRCPGLRHGKEFEALTVAACSRLWQN